MPSLSQVPFDNTFVCDKVLKPMNKKILISSVLYIDAVGLVWLFNEILPVKL